MFEFFLRVLGAGINKVRKPIRPRYRRRLRLDVEELTPRVLPSAGPNSLVSSHFAAGHHLETISQHAGLASQDTQWVISKTAATSGVQSSLEARLTNASGARGSAEFNPNTGALEVHIRGAAANASLTVAIDGNTVATITTDASGKGNLEITEANLAVNAGSTITVGDLQGTFSTSSEGSDEDNSDDGSAHSAELKAQLTGTAGAKGSAEFNAGEGRLEVKIKGAAANTTYNVTVDNVVVGQLTTGTSGRAEVELSAAGLSVQVGSTLTIADTLGNPPILQGVFAQPAQED